MAIRLNKLGIILGMNGAGKTKYFKGDKKLGLPGFIKAYLDLGMKVLIIDPIDHPDYQDIKALSKADFKKFTSGVARIVFDPDDIALLNQMLCSSPNINNTLIVYEDATTHTFSKCDKYLRRLMVNRKQWNLDILMMYHSFAQTPLDIWRSINYVELFKTQDSPEMRKKQMQGYYNSAERTYNQVRQETNRYFHKLIDTGL